MLLLLLMMLMLLLLLLLKGRWFKITIQYLHDFRRCGSEQFNVARRGGGARVAVCDMFLLFKSFFFFFF